MGNRILVVDDSRSFVTLMRDLLGAVGFQVATTTEGSAAIPEALDFHPDLILMDVEMPGLDGCEACRRIKRHPELSNIPVLLMSGDGGFAGRASAAGADAFLSKPFSLDRLLSQARALLGHESPEESWLQAG